MGTGGEKLRGKAGEERSQGRVRMEAENQPGPSVVTQRMMLLWGVQIQEVQQNRRNWEDARTSVARGLCPR